MSDASTTRLIDMYMDEAEAPLFLSGFFQSPPRNFHSSEKVEIDIIRDDVDVAVPIPDIKTDSRKNEANVWTSKSFTPPVYDEEGAIKAFDLIKRRPGVSPYADPDYASNATEEAFTIFRRLEAKIRRSIELQASQVLQTGKLAIKDTSGATVFDLDYVPKTSHFVTVGAAWAADGSTGDPVGDIESLAVVVRRDGKRMPNKLVFGKTALQRAKANANFLKAIDKTVLNLGQFAPEVRGQGATFQGYIWIGHYRFEMWTYDGFYRDSATAALTPYVTDDKVIMLSDGARLDLSYGAIPLLKRDPEALAFLPSRMSSSARGLDLTVNAWFTENGKALMVSAGTRPLCIPTGIDTFGCLDVIP